VPAGMGWENCAKGSAPKACPASAEALEPAENGTEAFIEAMLKGSVAVLPLPPPLRQERSHCPWWSSGKTATGSLRR